MPGARPESVNDSMNGEAPTVAASSPAVTAVILPRASRRVSSIVAATTSRRDYRRGCAHCQRGAADHMESAKNEYEALRAVDPVRRRRGSRRGSTAGPPRRSPLVGGEWSVPEGSRTSTREGDREAAEKWGPPREDLDRRTARLAAAGLIVALGIAIWLFGLGLRPTATCSRCWCPLSCCAGDVVICSISVPFAVLLVIYAQSRGIAHLLSPHPYYPPQMDADKFIFGAVPSESLQHWLWNGTQQWYDQVVLAVMRLHFIVPPLVAFALWVKRRASLLPLRGDHAHALLRRRGDLPPLSGGSAVGRVVRRACCPA